MTRVAEPRLVERVARLEAEVATARARHARFEASLARQLARRDVTRELVRSGAGARPLAITPLLASVVATFAALAAALSAYATLVGAGESWAIDGLVAAIVAFVSCWFARLPGAGGRARWRLERLAFAVALFAAVFLILGAGLEGRR
ncbi:MAG TPA: hypothetical protein VGM56_00215 [Byssovorax sp.]